jgi:hypothetical protein
MKLRSRLLMFLIALPLAATAQPLTPAQPLTSTTQELPGSRWLNGNDKTPAIHNFADKDNLRLQGINVFSQTLALLAIQSHDARGVPGGVEARGRTLDPFEKHFESYGYGWGAVYCYGGGVGLNLAVAYVFHATGHHKLERWVPMVSIVHAEASAGYALTGSKQGKNGW